MNFETKYLFAAAILVAGGCYSGTPTGMEDTDGASSETDGEEGGGPGGGPGGSGDSEGESGDETGGGGSAGPGDPPDPPDGCLPGALGCECLNGECMGLAACIDEICQPAPPVPEVNGPSAALAGVAIPLDGNVEEPDDGVGGGFESIEWEQTNGPDAMMEYEFSAQALAWLPAGAGNNAEFTFQLTATLGGVTQSGDYTVGILQANVNEVMSEMMDVASFGSTNVGRAAGSVWLATDLGLVARVGDKGIEAEEDLMGRVAQIRGYGDNRVLFLQPDNGRIMQFNANNNMFTEWMTELTNADPLGPVVSMAVDPNGDAYFGTEDGRIVFHDDEDDGDPAVTLDRYSIAQIPTAMTIGQHPVAPDSDDNDEGVVLYYGTDTGDVWQIGLTEAEVIDGPVVGEPAQYLSIPGTGPVTGIRVDDSRNMWVGKGNTLYLVRRPFDANPTVVREIDAPGGLGGFAGMHAADDNRLDWIDPSTGNIVSLQTYEN